MQHQSQGLAKGPTAGTTGIVDGTAIISAPIISAEEIERHIAEGKRMQAEAVAAFLKAACRWIGALFQRRPAHQPRPAVPHGA